MNLTDLVICQIEACFEQTAAEQAAFDAAVAQAEADGFRITDGGQISSEEWEYTDWRTGEVLATGTIEDGDDDLPSGGKWWHIDSVCNDIRIETEIVPGLPEWLANAIIEAVESNEDDARAWLNELRREVTCAA